MSDSNDPTRKRKDGDEEEKRPKRRRRRREEEEEEDGGIPRRIPPKTPQLKVPKTRNNMKSDDEGDNQEDNVAPRVREAERGTNINVRSQDFSRRGRQDRSNRDRDSDSSDDLDVFAPPARPSQLADSSDPPAEEPQARVIKEADRGPNLNVRSTDFERKGRRPRPSSSEDEVDWAPPPPITPIPPPVIPPTPTPPPTPELQEPETGTNPFQLTEEELQRGADEYQERMDAINEENTWESGSVTGGIVRSLLVKPTQAVMYEENTKQVTEGLKVINTVTERPLSKFWEIFTIALPQLLFLTGMIASLVDLSLSPVFLEYKVTSIVLDLLEILVVGCLLFVKRLPYYKNLPKQKRETFDKKKQLGENILAEVLLYPTMIMSIVGITSERSFEPDVFTKPESHLNRLDMVLLACDICAFIYVYCARVYMANKFIEGVRTNIPGLLDQTSRWDIVRRTFFTVICNFAVYACMLTLLAAQLYYEHYEEGEPTISMYSGYMVFATVTVPFFSILVSLFANYYWILELMIKVNKYVINEASLREKISTDYGEGVSDVVAFAAQNVHATPGRLRDIQTLGVFKRVFYVLREWWIDFLFLVWSAILLLYCYIVYDTWSTLGELTGWWVTFRAFYLGLFYVACAAFIIANLHSFAIVTITNLVLVPLCLTFALQSLINAGKSVANAGKGKKGRPSNAPRKPPPPRNNARGTARQTLQPGGDNDRAQNQLASSSPASRAGNHSRSGTAFVKLETKDKFTRLSGIFDSRVTPTGVDVAGSRNISPEGSSAHSSEYKRKGSSKVAPWTGKEEDARTLF